jgi:predicted transcriptional regulator
MTVKARVPPSPNEPRDRKYMSTTEHATLLQKKKRNEQNQPFTLTKKEREKGTKEMHTQKSKQ